MVRFKFLSFNLSRKVYLHIFGIDKELSGIDSVIVWENIIIDRRVVISKNKNKIFKK